MKPFLVVSLLALSSVAACSSSSTSPDPTTARAQAESIANGANPCSSDSDCCIVVDGCMSNALVVNASNRDQVASLVSEAASPSDGCLGCVSKAYQVACVAGQCTAHEVDRVDPDGGAPMPAYDSDLTRDHCGALPLPDGDVLQTSSASGAANAVHLQGVLGCGASIGL